MLRSSRHDDLTARKDYVVLADGSLSIVPRANLAAAKELLAAQRGAERRVAERRSAAIERYTEEYWQRQAVGL